MDKIRIGIVGYGNLGKGVQFASSQNPDTEIVAVFTRRDPASAGENRPGRRGPGSESAGITIQAAPSETEGAEVGAEARRRPRAGRRTLHRAVRPWGT